MLKKVNLKLAYTHPANNNKELFLPLYQLHANLMTPEETKLFAISKLKQQQPSSQTPKGGSRSFSPSTTSQQREDDASFFNYTIFSVDTSDERGVSLDDFRREYYACHRNRYKKHLKRKEQQREEVERQQENITGSKGGGSNSNKMSLHNIAAPPPQTWQTLENLLLLYKSGIFIPPIFLF